MVERCGRATTNWRHGILHLDRHFGGHDRYCGPYADSGPRVSGDRLAFWRTFLNAGHTWQHPF